jgi:pyridoxal phosphate enzyme (YggS family)
MQASIDTELQSRLEQVHQRISRAAAQAGRDPSSITLVAITKTFPLEVARKAYALGARHFGENRVQEIVEKWQHARPLGAEAREILHLVGHLQRNKVRKALHIVDRIDAVDTLELAEAISRVSAELGRQTDVLIEVNTSGEPQKYGIAPEAATDLARQVAELPHIRLRGLMTMGPLTEDTSQVAGAFRQLKTIFDHLKTDPKLSGIDTLSMGMTGDFEIAIAEGATEVRIGTALFGARSTL